MKRIKSCRSISFILVFVLVLDFQPAEGKFVCSPNDPQQRCQWTFYGWFIYRGCVYHQKIDGPLCLMKTFDGSKGTLLTKLNVTSKEFDSCFRFKYLTTGRISVCWYFYAKLSMKINTQSHLFSNFCIPNDRIELFWYSHSVVLPRNTILLNSIIETNVSIHNYSLTMTDLTIENCHQNIDRLTSTTTTMFDQKLIKSTSTSSSNISHKYRWIFVICLIILLGFFMFLVLIIFFRKKQRNELKIVRRVTEIPSRHFYEEPISIIVPRTIEINDYDHVRDNYI